MEQMLLLLCPKRKRVAYALDKVGEGVEGGRYCFMEEFSHMQSGSSALGSCVTCTGLATFHTLGM
jgi:hypothetical protein